jgi:hypothetical protein
LLQLTSERLRRAAAGVLHLAAAVLCLAPLDLPAATLPAHISSPDERLRLAFSLTEHGEPRYHVELDGVPVLNESRLGLVRDDADFTRSLQLVSASPLDRVQDEYELPTSKRRHSTYSANRQVFRLEGRGDEQVEIEFQVANDGIAFRYRFPETDDLLHRVESEASSFNFPPDTRAWLQPMARAKTGWSSTNPSYEEIYDKDIPAGTPSPTGAGWVYPALFRTGDNWLLVSETGLNRNYCGTRLESTWRNPEYRIAFPDPLENFQDGPVNPQHTLPWITPWRLVVIGDLETIVESNLGTDLADEPYIPVEAASDLPGKASWSWPLLGDGQTIHDTQKRFIDYAADMGWRYTLIDSMWDQQIGYDGLERLVDYARDKGVRILVWYNSAGGWNTAPQTPRNLMLTRESRLEEFARLKRIGIAGLKVDFFGGDGQSVIEYYQDILDDAAKFGFAMNFHGSTLPRGWHRTYPHLMTMEAVRGLEFVTFEQKNAEDEPTHTAMLPFTRNVFDPMDFTPVVLDRIDNIERRTTSAFELALSVLFTSGIQHYAEIPEGMAKAPAYVREFLHDVPAIWDDVEFVDGYPGRFVALARRSNDRWYVAGINAEKTPREIVVEIPGVDVRGATLIEDDVDNRDNMSFRRRRVEVGGEQPLTITLQPTGGFVMSIDRAL